MLRVFVATDTHVAVAVVSSHDLLMNKRESFTKTADV